jgi:hypothetical protein
MSLCCHYPECPYAECNYAECHYPECCYDECRYDECRHADSRGANVQAGESTQRNRRRIERHRQTTTTLKERCLKERKKSFQTETVRL